jgi:hypothetical protein
MVELEKTGFNEQRITTNIDIVAFGLYACVDYILSERIVRSNTVYQNFSD